MSYGSLCYSRARNCTSWNCQFGGGCLMSSPSSPFWNKRKWPLACGTCAQWLKERNLCRQGRRAVCCGNAAGAVCGQVYACGMVRRTSPFLLNESRSLCSARRYLSNNTRFSLEIYVCLKDLKKLCLVGERQTNFPFNTRDSWLRSKTLVLGSSWKYVKSSKIQCQEKNRQQTKKKKITVSLWFVYAMKIQCAALGPHISERIQKNWKNLECSHSVLGKEQLPWLLFFFFFFS